MELLLHTVYTSPGLTRPHVQPFVCNSRVRRWLIDCVHFRPETTTHPMGIQPEIAHERVVVLH